MKLVSVFLLIHFISSTIAAPVEANNGQERTLYQWLFGKKVGLDNSTKDEGNDNYLSSETNSPENLKENSGVDSYLSTLASYLALESNDEIESTTEEPSTEEFESTTVEISIDEIESTAEELNSYLYTLASYLTLESTQDSENESSEVLLREGSSNEDPNTNEATTVANEITKEDSTTFSKYNEMFTESEAITEEVSNEEIESTTEKVQEEDVESLTEEIESITEEIESTTEEIKSTIEEIESTTEDTESTTEDTESTTEEIEDEIEDVPTEDIESTTEEVPTQEFESTTEKISYEEIDTATVYQTSSSSTQNPPTFENTHGIDFTDCHPAFQQCDIVGIYSCNSSHNNTVCGIRYKSRLRN